MKQTFPGMPGSIGIHYEKNDSQVNSVHVIGYETGVRSDAAANMFSMVHVWNYDPIQGPMKYCFYCNGEANTFNLCYADSPGIAGFYINKPHVSITQCFILGNRWAKDNSGAGFLITPEGKDGTYIGNFVWGISKGHRMAKAFDGDLSGACILGNGFGKDVLGGFENRIPSGESPIPGPASPNNSYKYPPLNLAGTGFCLSQQTEPPVPEEGRLGEVRWVDDGKVSALWVKTSRGWKKSKLQ